MTKESSNLALKVIENEIKFLYKLLEDKDARIKELEKQIQKEKTTEYVGYNTL